MRETDRDTLSIDHILEGAQNVITFMEGKNLDNLKQDKILFFAVVKNIEIIGEAAFMITKEFKESHPEIPCKSITGMRHILVHDYYRISPEEIFKVYKDNLTDLIPKLKTLSALFP